MGGCWLCTGRTDRQTGGRRWAGALGSPAAGPVGQDAPEHVLQAWGSAAVGGGHGTPPSPRKRVRAMICVDSLVHLEQ